MAQGRPKSVRLGGTGEKLYMALKLSGLSWGTRIGPNHISVDGRWAQCGLPRSVNTVIEDIRSGIPAHRLERYAGYFQVPVGVFTDESVGSCSAAFSCEILRNKNRFAKSAAIDVSLHDSLARKHIVERNGVAANYPLYQLLSGVHKIYYKRDGGERIYQGAAKTETQTETGIAIAVVIVVDGIPVELSGTLFRWNNFIHIQYHSEDYQLLGYMIAPNPMESILLRRRDPFHMRFCGLSGSLDMTAVPDRYEACSVKQGLGEGRSQSEVFDALLGEVLREGALEPGDAAHARAAALFAGS